MLRRAAIWLLLDLPPWATYALTVLVLLACGWPIYIIATHTGAGCPVP